jgi:hypothetical protein
MSELIRGGTVAYPVDDRVVSVSEMTQTTNIVHETGISLYNVYRYVGQGVGVPPPRESLEEASDRRWKASFANSQDFLTEWGDSVLADFLAGKTEPLDPDKL